MRLYRTCDTLNINKSKRNCLCMKPLSDSELIKKLQDEVNEKNKTISELSEENFQLKNLLDNLPGDIYWKNIDGNWSGLNKHCATSLRNMGFIKEKKDILGKTDFDIFDKETAAGYRKNDLTAIKDEVEISLEEGTKLPNGDEVVLLSIKSPFYNSDNQVAGIVGNTIDITHLKKIERKLKIAQEKSEAANKSKAEFIANMSHDIRTPLTGIIGLSNMVENESHENEIKEYAHMLNISGEQLLSLLNSVLDIVASDTIGRKALRLSTFCLEDLLHSIFELELPSLQLKSIDFKLDMDEDLPQFIESDKEKIYRIVLNILSNAIKFTHGGAITIKATKISQKDDDIITKIQIIDTGIGIPKEDVSKVFDQFYRANPAHEGKFDGYGVGLHIVQKYLKLLKGEVLVESEVGKGTCISLTLPLKKASMPEGYVKPESPVRNDYSDTKTTSSQSVKPSLIENARASVLLVEDNIMARTVAKTMLTKANCQVLEAENSTDAFELFSNNRFDFVLTDIGLPDYSGLELAKQMQKFELEQGREKTPVITLSGHEDTENLAANEFKYGLAGMFTKPLRTEELTDILDQYGKDNEELEASNQHSDESNTNDNQLLDEELAIKQLGSIEMVREMAQMMLNDGFVKMIPEIDAHFQSQEWPEFKSKIHKFKSSCLYCATTQLLKFVEQLESLADSKNLDKITPVYDKFSACAEKTKQHIKTWLN